MTGPLAVLDHVARVFDDGRVRALEDINLTIHSGELIALTGPSGCGKSTMLNILAGIDRPDSGHVIFEGRRDPSDREWIALRSGRIGMIFQDFNLLPTLTAVENVEIVLFGHVRPASRRRHLAMERLEQVGVAGCAGRLPAECSGGERRRVGIARGLAGSPVLLLADEPTSNLDSVNGRAVMDLLLTLHADGGLTLMIATHDEAMIARCSRRIRMLDGAVVEDVTT